MVVVEELPSTPITPSQQNTSARQRKPKNKKKTNPDSNTSTLQDEIPLKRPSEITGNARPLIDVDLPENARLFTLNLGEVIDEDQYQYETSQLRPDEEQTGVLESEKEDGDGGEEGDDEIFNTLIMAVPFTFLYLLLDILVHLQYNHRPGIEGLVKGSLTALPTNRYPNHWLTNPFLMFSSIFSGCRLIWLVNKASWSVVTAQAPPMGTMWILTIVQLPLSRAVLVLGTVAAWIWWEDMKLMP
ncbi:uncharacterized protein I303_104566 [Kwoniella dejecticola CBS 10117]|uniref:DUF7719 domain-containing protein n=1 Tax=Kwoniella dejecticola CBS 10117 TaxID=1296121 RepID=A0AAJ8KPN7_9TREE